MFTLEEGNGGGLRKKKGTWVSVEFSTSKIENKKKGKGGEKDMKSMNRGTKSAILRKDLSGDTGGGEWPHGKKERVLTAEAAVQQGRTEHENGRSGHHAGGTCGVGGHR